MEALAGAFARAIAELAPVQRHQRISQRDGKNGVGFRDGCSKMLKPEFGLRRNLINSIQNAVKKGVKRTFVGVFLCDDAERIAALL